VGSFTTRDGQQADLLKGWGLTARDVQAIVAKAKAAAERKRTADKAKKGRARSVVTEESAGKQGQVYLTASAASGFAPLPVRKPSTGVRQWRVRLVNTDRPATPPLPARAETQSGAHAAFASAASRLGGPEPDGADVTPQAFDPEDGIALFLRAAHESACKRYGTALGPEAN